MGGSGVKMAEGDVGRPHGGVIRDEADWFEVDILGRCGPLSELCHGAEDSVEGVAYVVGEFGFVCLFAAGRKEVVVRPQGRSGSERKAKFAFGRDADKVRSNISSITQ